MNPFEASVIRISDPLSAHTRTIRKALLIASTVGAAVGKTGFIPTKVSALGLEFSQADRGSMIWLIGTIVGFLLISFLVSGTGDFMAWRLSHFAKDWDEESQVYENLRKSILENKTLTEEERQALFESERRLGAMWRNAGHVRRHILIERLVGPVSWGRATVEFALPIIGGIGALALLILATP